MKIGKIAGDYRVPLKRDGCGDLIIRGNNGHLYIEDPSPDGKIPGGAVMVCFTDDGRKKPFPSKQFKTWRLKKIRHWVRRITQDGEFEFTAEIEPIPEAIRTALFAVLRVRRFMRTKGVPKSPEVREKLRKHLQGLNRAKKAAATSS